MTKRGRNLAYRIPTGVPTGHREHRDAIVRDTGRRQASAASSRARGGHQKGTRTIMAEISIPRIATEQMRVPIRGLTPLIVHNFADKQRRMMLDAQQGRKAPREIRDPGKEYESAFYRTKDGYGFPAAAFKQATVDASRFYGRDVTKTALKQCIFIAGIISDLDAQALVEIVGEPRMREDVVRLGGISRSADLRYRPEFPEWSCVLDISYASNSLSRESVLSLLDAGGMGVGVGEWRVEKGGDFGKYCIDPTREVEVLNA